MRSEVLPEWAKLPPWPLRARVTAADVAVLMSLHALSLDEGRESVPRTILYLHAASTLGGSQISILTLMRYLDPSRYTSTILLPAAGPFLDLARSYGVDAGRQDFRRFRKRRPWVYLRGLYHLVRTIRTRCVSLVHMNCLPTLLYASPVCRRLGVPYVFHVRDARQPWFDATPLEAVNRSHAVIANSAFIASICREKAVSPHLIRTVYNPIEAVRFSQVDDQAGSRLRSSLDISSDAIVFAFVGKLHPIKGPDLFIKAAGPVLVNLSDAHFIIAGTSRDEAYYDELRSLARDGVLQSKVHVLGFRLDIPAVMHSADVLVVPSRDEAFGRVAVEGMASGCPLIVSRVGGLVEIVTQGLDGIVIPPDDVDALSVAMIRLAQDAGLRARLAENGYETARRFAPERHADEIQAIYDDILEGDNA